MSVVGQEQAVLHNLRFLISLAWFDLLLTEEERRTLERIADNTRLSPTGRRQAQEWIDRMPGFPEQLVIGCQGFMSPEDIILAAYYIAYVDGTLDPKEEIAIGMGAEILGLGPTRLMEIKAKFLDLTDRESALKLPEWRAGAAEGSPPLPKLYDTYDKGNPFMAKLLVNKKLTGEGSWKDVRHFEIDLEDSGPSLAYKAGDALGVHPDNDPKLVEELLAATGLDGASEVKADDKVVKLHEALTRHFTITRPFRKLYTTLKEKLDAGEAKDRLAAMLDKSNTAKLKEYTDNHEVLDVLADFPKVEWSPQELVDCMTAMRGRLYSISSSPKAHKDEVHLCVRRVDYETSGKKRFGVCSNFMSNMAAGGTMPVYLHSTQTFLCPEGDVPLIMCGPGTGIAPFRAFIEERVATGSKGKNWLFFGEQQADHDYLYGEELQKYEKDGKLKMTIAWSRTGDEKWYVQDRMRQNAKEIWEWLDNGAVFAVCGDARRMAKDVDKALHEIVQEHGGKDEQGAKDFMKALKKDGRYIRDVY